MYEERLLWPAYPSNFSLCEINMATQSQKRWKSMFVTNTSPQSGESVDFESKKAFPSKENGWRLLFSEDQREKFTAPSYVSDFNFFCRSTTVARNVWGKPWKNSSPLYNSKFPETQKYDLLQVSSWSKNVTFILLICVLHEFRGLFFCCGQMTLPNMVKSPK